MLKHRKKGKEGKVRQTKIFLSRLAEQCWSSQLGFNVSLFQQNYQNSYTSGSSNHHQSNYTSAN